MNGSDGSIHTAAWMGGYEHKVWDYTACVTWTGNLTFLCLDFLICEIEIKLLVLKDKLALVLAHSGSQHMLAIPVIMRLNSTSSFTLTLPWVSSWFLRAQN